MLNNKQEADDFEGVAYNAYDKMETFFDCSICLYTIEDENPVGSLLGNLIYRSQSESNRVSFHAVGDRICLIKNLNLLFKKYLLQSSRNLENHSKTCVKQTKHVYLRGKYSPSLSFFDEFQLVGLNIPLDLQFCNAFFTFNFESILQHVV